MELHDTIYIGLKILLELEGIKWMLHFLSGTAWYIIYRTEGSVTCREQQVIQFNYSIYKN